MASDVELPPTSSNLNWLMEEEELYKDSPLKGLLAQMARGARGEKKVNRQWTAEEPTSILEYFLPKITVNFKNIFLNTILRPGSLLWNMHTVCPDHKYCRASG